MVWQLIVLLALFSYITVSYFIVMEVGLESNKTILNFCYNYFLLWRFGYHFVLWVIEPSQVCIKMVMYLWFSFNKKYIFSWKNLNQRNLLCDYYRSIWKISLVKLTHLTWETILSQWLKYESIFWVTISIIKYF